MAKQKKQTKKADQLHSEFKTVDATLLVHLPPRFVGETMKGVTHYLNSLLMRYVAEVGGVVLSFKNIKLLESSGRILFDNPYTHFNVSVRFTVFAPERSSILTGVVNKVSSDHIGLLVHGVFNASIAADQIRKSEFRWDSKQSAWIQKSDKSVIDSNAIIRFTVLDIVRADDMFTIVGSLVSHPNKTGLVDSSNIIPAPVPQPPPASTEEVEGEEEEQAEAPPQEGVLDYEGAVYRRPADAAKADDDDEEEEEEEASEPNDNAMEVDHAPDVAEKSKKRKSVSGGDREITKGSAKKAKKDPIASAEKKKKAKAADVTTESPASEKGHGDETEHSKATPKKSSKKQKAAAADDSPEASTPTKVKSKKSAKGQQ
ncbi:uncharacterized protein BJ171DRAFT_157625 [Polychytrium aggregatum]|uniref:uncharacterized protein n=1 Tax=Polychytrium aggregatum TaxID=110093 RepID=UPI0022FDF93D|nr:uncharacterized protein BJ171DRAFT_157625 [Polychytrium aggregatum]KAI9202985.1 hypothetical protein BJ171DRAFT_157625 [Polychytrium aggregatum]